VQQSRSLARLEVWTFTGRTPDQQTRDATFYLQIDVVVMRFKDYVAVFIEGRD
jgi:hypothetical protein